MDNEKYIEFAFGNYDSKKFLKYFKNENEKIYLNYINLNSENGTLDDFYANPLVFILMNEPRCCLNIAKLFIDSELK